MKIAPAWIYRLFAPTGLHPLAQGCASGATLGTCRATIQPQRGCVDRKVHVMSQSLSAVFVHLVFSTKERQRFLIDAQLRAKMHAYLGGVSAKLDSPPLLIGGTEDHIHALCRLGRTVSQADWVKELKRTSSAWIKERDASLSDFGWQSGYGVFSVSSSNLEAVRAYIATQEEHHQNRGFQEEYRAFLRKHKLEWDERYVWD